MTVHRAGQCAGALAALFVDVGAAREVDPPLARGRAVSQDESLRTRTS